MAPADTQVPRRTLWWTLLGSMLGFALVSMLTTTTVGAAEAPDLSRFDTDTYPAIDVSHRVPAVVASDELVELEFTFACGYFAMDRLCEFTPVLHVAYGQDVYRQVALNLEDRDTLEVWTAATAAVDASGEPLRYYLEVRDNRNDVDVRYPADGAIEPFVATEVTRVALPTARAIEGSSVAMLPWGEGIGEVGLDTGPEQSTNGPEAMATNPSGSALAVLDGINQRAIVLSTINGEIATFPIDARLGDIAINDHLEVSVLDSIGDSEGAGIPQPTLSMYAPDGHRVGHSVAYVNVPYRLTDQGSVVGIDTREITPLSEYGAAMARDEQRTATAAPELAVYFRHDGRVLVGDRSTGTAFEVTADDGVGPVAIFEKRAGLYVLAMRSASGMRIAWIGLDGTIESYVETPLETFADMSPTGRVAVDSSATVYLMESKPEGVVLLEIAEVSS